MNWLINCIINWATKFPYRKGHIFHNDGSVYMRRYCVFECRWFAIRLHHIVTEDRDDLMHDHPWTFISVVLSGGYIEQRPIHPDAIPSYTVPEPCFSTFREEWSIARRKAGHRHRISFVYPNTWTLFITGPITQEWGFYGSRGKIHWKEYLESGGSRFAKGGE